MRLEDSIQLLKKLIATKSLSKQENETAEMLTNYLINKGHAPFRIKNNVICHQALDSTKPTIVLNSHHDTVKVSEGWTKDPFGAEDDGKLIYGLGSNDAGASLVCLLHTYLDFAKNQSLPYNLVFIASAEEEISGKEGLELALKEMDIKPDLAIVGEPTSCAMATAEKGLMVIDGEAKGTAGHAANQWGDNAIYDALKDIQWIENFAFEKVSEFLGKVKLTVTQIEAGYQHNIVPDSCKFVIDCRVTDAYSLESVLAVLQENCTSTLTPRSVRLQPSTISIDHPIVQKAMALNINCYGSNTLSDQVFFTCPSVKIGPGDTNRSHKADEYITHIEIQQGLDTYTLLLQNLNINKHDI
jgi:acetylornithine deacetylase